MILRALKFVAIAAVLWFALPWFTVEIPDNIFMGGLERWAVLQPICLCLQMVFLVSLLANIWAFGKRQNGGQRLYRVQHRRLLLYSGISILFLVLMPGIDLEWRYYSRQAKIKFGIGAALCFMAVNGGLRSRQRKDKKSVYGLQHGRLHLNAHVPMWMNMGYWKACEKDASRHKSLAEACRDLLKFLLTEAGISKETTTDRSRCLIDVGFGCGEQTIHLMSEKPIRPSDKLWWDDGDHKVYFEQYIGVTQDKSQCRYAEERVDEMKRNPTAVETRQVALFCADASRPEKWSGDLLAAIDTAKSESYETWLLALDTAYHFSPSRWVLIQHARLKLNASFMAFDLCLSPKATLSQKLLLRILTTLMGAPWANFVTPDAYQQKLIDVGYCVDAIKIVDISEHVFAPLATYMDEQDRRLETLGLGLGSFHAAKSLFKWWGRTGVIRGVVVVAKRDDSPANTEQ